jgi:hypothetical protein
MVTGGRNTGRVGTIMSRSVFYTSIPIFLGIKTFFNYFFIPMIYTAPCVKFLMRADTLRGQVGGGWALEMEFFGAFEIASSR